jgi:hypothetical protein
MQFLVMLKATEASEAGQIPPAELFARVGAFNEELVRAGIMLAAEGLTPSSQGKRIKWTGEKHAVTDGPFAETKELVAGFWLLEAKSMDEAVAWMSRAPFDHQTVEIRRLYEASDFPADVFPPELAEREEFFREQLAKKGGET